jgi:hypothetical protein
MYPCLQAATRRPYRLPGDRRALRASDVALFALRLVAWALMAGAVALGALAAVGG